MPMFGERCFGPLHAGAVDAPVSLEPVGIANQQYNPVFAGRIGLFPAFAEGHRAGQILESFAFDLHLVDSFRRERLAAARAKRVVAGAVGGSIGASAVTCAVGLQPMDVAILSGSAAFSGSATIGGR